jgi:hypothetical protein
MRRQSTRDWKIGQRLARSCTGDIYLPSISQKYEDEEIHDVFPSIVNR